MGGLSRAKKVEYFKRLREYLEEYKSVLVVGIDNVSSQQMHEVRKSMRGKGDVLMGKNTMVRKVIRDNKDELPQFTKLLPFVKGNVGFIFTNNDLKEIKELIVSNKVKAPARPGALAPEDIWVTAVNTGMEPGKTSFFQALGVPTKITRGTIEIVSDVKVVNAGNRVGQSEASLLNLLNISPFTYGMTIDQVYDDGQLFSASVLDITEEQLLESFTESITNIASVSLACDYPTLPSVPHYFLNSYKDMFYAAIGIDYVYPEIAELLDRLDNPEKYAAEAAAAAEAVAATKGAEKEEEKADDAEDEDEDDEDDDMGFGMFD